VISLITFYDAVIARLHVAAGNHAEARDRVDAALQLAAETGMHFHDAELLRIRAHTQEDSGLRRADLSRAIELARKQNALIYELRCTVEDFELRGEPARQQLTNAIDRFPVGSTWPPLAHAQALLG